MGGRQVIGTSFRRAIRVAAAAVICAAAGLGATGLPVRAGSLTFGTPTATAKFGAGIQFVQPYTGSGSFREVLFVMTEPGATGRSLTLVPATSTGRFEFVVESSQAQLLPGTKLTGHFQVTFSDGSVQSGPDVSATYLDDRFDWHTKTGKLVRLHWYQGDDAFATEALRIGEQGIEADAAFLSTTVTEPVDFWVYPDEQPFYDVLGPDTPPGVGGRAYTDIRTLFAWIGPGDFGFARTVVPHELMHVVFADVIRNPYCDAANWINEGTAVYATEGYSAYYRHMLEGAVSDGTLMPLAAISGQFPTSREDRFRLAYAESVSAIDYFVRTYGKATLVKLVKSYAGGLTDDEAFNAAIGMDLAAFDKAWMKSVGLAFYPPYGPGPAPTGPVPPGWTTPAAGATPAAATASPAAAASGTAAAISTSSRLGASIVGTGEIQPPVVAVLGALAVAAALALAFVRRRLNVAQGRG